MKNDIIRNKETGVCGYKKCPSWLKKAYLRAVNYKCQQCQEENTKLTPHRIIRGNEGGLYTCASIHSKQNNVKILCEDCHKALHSMEQFV